MMRLKTLASVSTLAMGLALSGAALADVTADDNALGLGNATDGSNAATLSHQANGNTTTGNSVGNTANPDSSQHNQTGYGDASTGGKNIASNNALSDSSTHSADNSGYGDASNGGSVNHSNNADSSTHSTSAGTNSGAGNASNGGSNELSNNSVTADNNNNQSKNITRSAGDNTGVGNASNGGMNVGSNDGNGNTKSKGDISGDGNASNGGRVADSNNSDTSTHSADNSGYGDASNGGQNLASNNSLTNVGNDNSQHTKNVTITVRAAVSNETLTGAVTGVFTKMGGHSDNGSARTGDITGGTINGFAGIQTATNNTGISSLNQAATSIAANANVTFGNANH